MKIILLKISVGLVLFFTVIYMCINTAALEDASPETLCDYTDFHMEYYYTTPPENGEYFYIGQEGRSEPDEVIQVTIRFVNDGKYPIDIDNMVITENDIVFCTAEDLGKTLPGKYTEFGFPAMGSMGLDARKYFDEESGCGVKRIHVTADFDVVTLDENLNVAEILDHLTRELDLLDDIQMQGSLYCLDLKSGRTKKCYDVPGAHHLSADKEISLIREGEDAFRILVRDFDGKTVYECVYPWDDFSDCVMTFLGANEENVFFMFQNLETEDTYHVQIPLTEGGMQVLWAHFTAGQWRRY